MLSFVVVDNPSPLPGGRLTQAYCIGPKDEPTQGELRLEPGAGQSVIRVDRPGQDSVALALLYSVGSPAAGEPDVGTLMLQTSLLPDRDEPYLLSLELARHRIMLVLNKLEQWAMFDLASDTPGMAEFERARGEFTRALVALCHRERGPDGQTRPDPASVRDADTLARRALALAIDAGEKLTLLCAARQLKGRLDGSVFREAAARVEKLDTVGGDRVLPEGAAKPPDGVGVALPRPASVVVAVNPAAFAEPLTRAAATVADAIAMPMRWSDMEPGEGKYAFARTDKWIEWAVRTAKMPVHAGPLIDFRELCVPEWLYIWEHDYETLRELVYEHVKTLVTRYRKTVTRWTACSGLHVNETFAMTLERMMDLTRICALTIKKLQPTARVQVEVSRPWGEYFAHNKRSMPPRVYCEMIGAAGIAVDALALRVPLGQPAPGASGRGTRDLMALSDLLDRYAEFDKPLYVTLGCPSQASAPVPAGSAPGRGGGAAEEAGWWRAAWGPATQGAWAREAMRVCASKPFVVGVCWQDLYDLPAAQAATLRGGGMEMAFGGLVDDQGRPKPAATAVAELRRALGAPTRVVG